MNAWVKYIDRSYSAIRNSIQTALTTNVPELTDRSPSNLMMIIVDIFAGVAELLNYYIDITARELFLPTARRFASVLRLGQLVHYHGRAKTSAYTTVTFTTRDSSNDPIASPADFSIPAGSVLRDIKGNKWMTTHNQVFRKDFETAQVSVAQYEAIEDWAVGTSDGSVSQSFALPGDYKDSTLAITAGSDLYELVESFGFSSPTDKHCVVRLQADGKMYVIFGDGVHGFIPISGATITSDYYATKGAAGNTTANSITTVVSTITLPAGVSSLTVTNPNDALGGKEIETLEELRRAIPIALRTLNRAVTKKDYEDVAILHPDVRAARVNWDCGARIQVYLVSHGGGNPPLSVLNNVKDFILARSMMTLDISTHPSGETEVRGIITITGRFRALATVIEAKAKDALRELYNPYTSQINQDIRTSDIIAAIDNIPEVDYLILNAIYVQPYLRPSNVAAPLNYRIEVLEASVSKTAWTIVYDDSDPSQPFNVYREGTFLVKLAAGTSVNSIGGLINLQITDTPGAVVSGDYWSFVVYPYNRDINLDDLSIPVVKPSSFTLNIAATYVTI